MKSGKARGYGWVVGGFLGAVLTRGVDAWAQPIPVIRVQAQGETSANPGAVHRVAAAIGPDAMIDAPLAHEVAQRYAGAALAGDPLAGARERARAARRGWQDAATAGDDARQSEALGALDAAVREMEQSPEAMDASPESRLAVQQSLVFLAERYESAGSATRAEDAMRRLAALDPTVAFSAREASPAVQEHYAHAVAALPRGALSVDSIPAGCTVLRDGRAAGTAPVELQDLVPGRHRIAVQCGAVRSLVHSVDVAARTRATLVIDTRLDSALVSDGGLALRYPSLPQGRARLAGDLATLGRALGARRVYGVIEHDDRVVVVDVAAAAEVGESPVTDGARLRLLAEQSVSTPAVTSNAPHAATPARDDDDNDDRAHGTPAVHAHGATVERHSGVPVGGVVLGVVGLAALGGGVYAMLWSADAQSRADQSSDALARQGIEGDRDVMRAVEIGCYAGGGVLLLTGILVSALGRSTDTLSVHAAVVPTPGGGVLSVEGVF